MLFCICVLATVALSAVILSSAALVVLMVDANWSIPLLLVLFFVVIIWTSVTASSLSSTLSAFSLLLTVVRTSFDASLSVFEAVVSVLLSAILDASLSITAAVGSSSAPTLSFGEFIDLSVALITCWFISLTLSVGWLTGMTINRVLP